MKIDLLYLLLGLLRSGNEPIEIVWIIFGKSLIVSEVLSAQRTGGFVGEMLWVLNRLLEPLNPTRFMHVMFFITVQLKDHSKLFAFILFLLIRILTNQTLFKQFSLYRSERPGIKVFAATNKPVEVFLCCFKDLFFFIVIPTLNYLIIIVIKVDRFL
jgi:hypothetical protein